MSGAMMRSHLEDRFTTKTEKCFQSKDNKVEVGGMGRASLVKESRPGRKKKEKKHPQI